MLNGKGKLGPLSQHAQRGHVCVITRQSMLPTRVLFAVVQSLGRVQLCTPRAAARQASLSFTNSRSLLNLMSTELMMPSNHLILCHPFSSCLQPFPASGSLQISQFFALRGQSFGALASVLPMNIQDCFPLGWTGWISSKSKGLSRVFSDTTVQKRQFFSAQSPLWFDSHIHTGLLEKPQL